MTYSWSGRLLAVAILASLILSLVPMVGAQDGTLTPEEQALLDRAFAAQAAVESYDSYIAQSAGLESQAQTITQDGAVLQEASETVETSSFAAIVRGADPNGFMAVRRTVTPSDDAPYTQNAEMRYVEGTLYVLGEYLDGLGFEVFNEDFVLLTDPALAGDFNIFEPSDFVDAVNGVADDDNPLNDPVLLGQIVSSLTSEVGDLDGTPAEIITMTIAGTDLDQVLLALGEVEAGDPTLALLDSIDETSGAVFTVYLGDGDQLLQTQVSLVMNIVGVDANTLDPSQPEGSTFFDLSVTNSELIVYSNVNAVEDVVPAPATFQVQ